MEHKKQDFTFPHMFTLILLIITACTILTYVVPAGRYDTYVDENDVEVFVDGSYRRIEQTPVTPMKAIEAGIGRIIKKTSKRQGLLIPVMIFGVGFAAGSFVQPANREVGRSTWN